MSATTSSVFKPVNWLARKRNWSYSWPTQCTGVCLQATSTTTLSSQLLSLWPGSWWPAVSVVALLRTCCRRFTLHFNLTKTGQRTNKNYIPVFTSLKLFNSYQAFKIDNNFKVLTIIKFNKWVKWFPPPLWANFSWVISHTIALHC